MVRGVTAIEGDLLRMTGLVLRAKLADRQVSVVGKPWKEPRLQAVDLHHKRAGTISALRSGQSQSMPEGADFAGCSVCGNRQAGVNTLSELGVNTERGRSVVPRTLPGGRWSVLLGRPEHLECGLRSRHGCQ